jgi:carboxylesterase type B
MLLESVRIYYDLISDIPSIYGGGFSAGSAADQPYNLSGLVQVSQEIGQPIIAVSMNYRLGVWGFLSSPEVMAEKNTNAGLMDQRMAFSWIVQNIDKFGGDPKRVTLWGHSAGAQSIGLHLHSFGGRDDGLYHGAILESGSSVGTALQELPFYATPFVNMTKAVGCNSASDKMACLRQVPSKDFAAKNPKFVWNPIVGI